jgi:CcmD family protein
MLRRLGTGLLLVWLWSSHASSSQAQEAAQETATDDRAADFKAVTGGTKEDVAGGPLMLVGYGVVWVAIFGYVWRLGRLQRDVEANVERLERSVSNEASRS